MRRVILFALAVLAVARIASASASGFVYVAVPATPCSASPCAPPEVLVFDAETAALAIRLPLPVQTMPYGIAISLDGAHLYVSNGRVDFDASITVIDARRHVIVGSYATGPGIAGELGVRGDDSRVFVLGQAPDFSTRLSVFDTTTQAVVDAVTWTGEYVASLAVSAQLDRVYVCVGGPLLSRRRIVTMYDAGSLAALGQAEVSSAPAHMAASRDGGRLYLVSPWSGVSPLRGGDRYHLDADSLAQLFHGYADLVAGTPVESPATDELLMAVFNRLVRFSRSSNTGSSVTLPGQSRVVTLAQGDTRAYVATTASQPGEITGLIGIDLATSAIVRTAPLPAAGILTSTPAGAEACHYRVDSAYSSWPVNGGSAALRLTTDCAWQASSSESWVRIGSALGSGSSTIDITVDPNVFPTPRTATLTIGGQLVRVTQAGGNSQPPFGTIDTPADGLSGVTGSLAVTGWALDDVGVKSIHLYRDSVAGEPAGVQFYIGDATFVEGARPDVQAAFPTLPFASRAGWGYLLLTNMLPNGGNGTNRIYAYAEDVEGHQTLIAWRTFSASNATAAVPFGAIDTPGQGETVSGTIVNWAWALTPGTATIVDGSMIDVVIDGVVVGHPIYGLFRSDIASLFPSYTNSSGAVGYVVIDTTALTDGVHTLYWIVHDNLGRAQGIGSRYFNVQNP